MYKQKSGKIKNIIIIVLALLLVFSAACIYYAVNVTYEPVIDAVDENTQLKKRVAELEEELREKKAEPTSSAVPVISFSE